MRLLLVEDNPSLGQSLEQRLNAAGFVVDWVLCGEDAETAVASTPFQLVILDRRLPDGDGVDRIAALRRFRPAIRILVLTALDATPEKIGGLNAGADDYLTKPIDPDELIARVRAALRRPGGDMQPPIACANLSYDPGNHEFCVNGAPILLKRRELLILETLMMRARRVVQRQTFFDQVYGFNEEIQSNTLEAHVSRLRVRLMDQEKNGQASKAEFMKFMSEEFDRVNSDRSGSITPEQLSSSFIIQRQHPQPAGAGK